MGNFRSAGFVMIGFVTASVCLLPFIRLGNPGRGRALAEKSNEVVIVTNTTCDEVRSAPAPVPPIPSSPAPDPMPVESGLRCSGKDPNIENFRNLCQKFSPVTDKVTSHSYHFMYGMFLSGRVVKPIKFMEIGLGCDMQYGPGASVNVWKSYLHPGSEIWMGEKDIVCVGKFKNSKALEGIKFVTGDQGNRAVLDGWLKETGGGFDVLIDDGGHSNQQIMNTFNVFWPSLAPGGLYFIEDLQVGRADGWQDRLDDGLCMTDVIKMWIDALLIPGAPHHRFPLPEGVISIACQSEACVLVKK